MGDLDAGDVLAMTSRDNGGFLEGNGIIILLLFLLFLGGGFGGMGNAATQGALTRADIQDTIENQNIINSLNNMALANNTGFNQINSNIAQLGFNMQQCCCDIKTAVNAQGDLTRSTITSLINANTMQDLRDKLADKDRELNSAIFAASQMTQTRTLEDFILANK